MVGGQLHHEWGRIARKHLCLFQHNAGYDDCENTDEISAGCNPPRAAKQRAGNQRNDWELGAARDEGGGHDRHFSIPVIFDRPRGHNAGHTAAGGDQHRDERFAGKAEFTEDPIHHKGDTRHISAGFQEGKEQKQHQHLRHKAEHRAHTGDDAVQDQLLQPLRAMDRLKPLLHKAGDTGNPYAVCSGGWLFYFGSFKISVIINRDFFFHITVIIIQLGGRRQAVCLHGVSRVNPFFFCRRFKRLHLRAGNGISFGRLFIGGRTNAKQMPAIAENTVVRPIRCPSADCGDGNEIDDEHNRRENRQRQPAVCDHLIDFIGGGKPARIFSLAAAPDDGGYVEIALIGDDALRIIIHLLLRGLDIFFDMAQHRWIKL